MMYSGVVYLELISLLKYVLQYILPPETKFHVLVIINGDTRNQLEAEVKAVKIMRTCSRGEETI